MGAPLITRDKRLAAASGHAAPIELFGSIRVKVGGRGSISWTQIEQKPCLGEPINKTYGNLYPGLSSQRYTFV